MRTSIIHVLFKRSHCVCVCVWVGLEEMVNINVVMVNINKMAKQNYWLFIQCAKNLNEIVYEILTVRLEWNSHWGLHSFSGSYIDVCVMYHLYHCFGYIPISLFGYTKSLK